MAADTGRGLAADNPPLAGFLPDPVLERLSRRMMV